MWTSGCSPRSWASVVRPQGAPREHDYGQLYMTDDAQLVGIRYENHCYMVYNVTRHIFLGHGDVEEVSPFLCIGANTRMHQPDIDRLMNIASEGTPGTAGYPRERAVLEDLEHPNMRVRELAREVLGHIRSR